MKKIKKCVFISVILAISLLFTSCWNYREINELSVINGFTIDEGKENYKYDVTAEILAPKLAIGRDKVKSRLVEIEGDTLFKAARRIIEVDGKKAYWSHAKVMIVSKAIAEKGLISVIDFANRNPEPRPDLHILIADMDKAKEIYKLYGQDVSVISFKLQEMLENEGQIATYKAVDLWRFINDLTDEVISPIAPILYLSEIEGKKMPKIGGIAVFKVDAFISFIIVSIFVGISEGMPLQDVVKSVKTDIGNTLGSVVMILGFGSMLGKLVAESGAAQRITSKLIQIFGIKTFSGLW